MSISHKPAFSAATLPFESLDSRCMMAADLTASILSPLAGTTLAAGVENRVVIAVSNIGDARPADRVGVKLFASADGTLDPAADILLGSRSVSRVNVGQTESQDIEFVLPAGLTGKYQLFAMVDPANAVSENNESNNISPAVTLTLGASGGGTDDHGGDTGGGADDHGGDTGGGGGTDDGNGTGTTVDLTVTLTAPTAPLIPNGQTKVFVSAANSGAATARNVLVQIFAQRGEAPSTSGDLLLGQRTLTSVSAGEHESEDIEFLVPATLGAGAVKLYAVIDGKNQVVETDETNNTSPTVDGAVLAMADLSGSISSLRLSSQVVEGISSSASISYSLLNSGNKPFDRSASTTVRAFLRPESADDNSRDIPVGSSKRESLSSLASGISRSRDLRVSIPRSVPAGKYRLVVVLDDSGRVSESNEHNNVMGSDDTIHIAVKTVDLSVSSGAINSSIRPGQKVTSTIALSNLGNSAAKGPATIQFFLRDTAGNEIAASPFITRKLSINAGKSTTLSRLPLTLPAGIDATLYTVIVRVTPATTIADTNAANNTFVLGSLHS